MKNWIKPLALAAGVFLASGAMAQKLSPEERIEKMNANLTKELNLTPEQQPQVAEANKNFVMAVYDARTNKDRKAAIVARESHHQALKDILTAEQYQKFQGLKKERKRMRIDQNKD